MSEYKKRSQTSLNLSLFIIIYSIIVSNVYAMPKLDYNGSEFCAKCHVEQYDAWSRSAHFNASSSIKYINEYQLQGSPASCLSCHTTGYTGDNGELVYENIQCESCHIPVREIQGSMYLTQCLQCHSSKKFPTHFTYNDPQTEHSHLGLECNLCHEPMSLEIISTNVNELCENCHNYDSSFPVSEDHGLGYECINCHLVYREADEGSKNSAHFFISQGLELDCVVCHDVSLEVHVFDDDCVTCHDVLDTASFRLLAEEVIDFNESSILCEQCHGAVYSEWVLGIHANNYENKVCVGCHNPHSPYIIVNDTLPPVISNEECIQAQNRWEPVIAPTLFFLGIFGALLLVIYKFYLIKE